jgi:hypothetical protein
VIVQGGGHGSEAAGPVVRDVIKAYYDKKAKKNDGEFTAEQNQPDLTKAPPAVIQPAAALKQQGEILEAPARAEAEPQPQ